MMKPESIYYLFEPGIEGKQEDYIWPVAGRATVKDKVFIVCDGAGSFRNGGIAGELISRFMATKVLKFSEQKMSEELIDKLLVRARDQLITYARENRLDTDLTTTFSMLNLYSQKALMSWCGDSRIYHLRAGVILFKTEDNSRNTGIGRGIRADSSPIYAGTKWIKDVRDGDYFLLCSKGLMKNITDDDIKLLVSQNDKLNIDLAASFRRLALEKTPDNYSMYLIRVKAGTQKRSINNGITTIRKRMGGMVKPFFILAMTIVGLSILLYYFREAPTSEPAPVYRHKKTQSADVLRGDSVAGTKVISVPAKTILTVTDSVKNNSENPKAASQNDPSAAILEEVKPEQTNQTPIDRKKQVAQMLIRLTTDESCKLKITNTDLDQVIDWDLSPSDNGTLYLKPGKYSIVATSVVSSKTKSYNFDVKPGDAHTTQNLQIKF